MYRCKANSNMICFFYQVILMNELLLLVTTDSFLCYNFIVEMDLMIKVE